MRPTAKPTMTPRAPRKTDHGGTARLLRAVPATNPIRNTPTPPAATSSRRGGCGMDTSGRRRGPGGCRGGPARTARAASRAAWSGSCIVDHLGGQGGGQDRRGGGFGGVGGEDRRAPQGGG